jgi:hypothetical protein
MDGFTWAAFACYLLAVIGSVIAGFTYLLSPKCMNYHEVAMGKKWGELDVKLQTLLLALMKSCGGAILSVCLAMVAMLVFPFRSGERWSYYIIPICGLILIGIPIYAMMLVKRKTNAKPPIIVNATAIVLIFIGIILSSF